MAVLKCPLCGVERELTDRVVGRIFRCPGCNAKLRHNPDGPLEVLEVGRTIVEGDAPAGPSPLERMSGRTLGRYAIKELVGRGGYGLVYKAEHLSLKRQVAVKLLSPKFLPTPEHVERLAGEAVSLARVDHPNVARVYDFGTEQGIPYLAMEYVEGVSLAERLRTMGPLFPEDLDETARGLLAGIQAIHAAGLLHRDIKPGNVLLDIQGRAKLVDFGLAREIPGNAAGRTRIFEGTAAYAAPELAEGRPPDVRSDLYSLGATLYHAATGQPPFPGSTTAERLANQRFGRLVPPRHLSPRTPQAIEDLILGLLEKDPARRPASAEDAAALLSRLGARTPPAPAARNRIGAVVVPLALLALVGLGVKIAYPRIKGMFAAAESPLPAPVIPKPDPEPAAPPVVPAMIAAQPSVLRLRQGTTLSGLVTRSGATFEVITSEGKIILKAGDVLRWFRASGEMAAEADTDYSGAAALLERARGSSVAAERTALFQDATVKLERAREGYQKTRAHFTGEADRWLDDRIALCLQGLRQVREEPAAPPVVGVPAPPLRAASVPGVKGRSLDERLAAALAWLARHQEADGSWKVTAFNANCRAPGRCFPGVGIEDHQVGVSALAVLAMLGAGIGVNDHDTYEGANIGESLRRGVAALAEGQGENGGLVPGKKERSIYDHLYATWALAEAVRSSGLGQPVAPDAYARWRASLERAVGYAVEAQNSGRGWGYAPRSATSDTSVTAVAVAALAAARRAGCAVPQRAFEGALAWFSDVTEGGTGRVGYSPKNPGKVFDSGRNDSFDPHETMTAAAEVSRRLIGETGSAARPDRRAAELLLKDRPQGVKWAYDLYYWFWGTRLMVQSEPVQWKSWKETLLVELLPAQMTTSGDCSGGSWRPEDRWAHCGGRIGSTAFAALILEVALLPKTFAYTGVRAASPEPEYRWVFHLKSGGRIRALSYEKESGRYTLRIPGGQSILPVGEVERVEAIPPR